MMKVRRQAALLFLIILSVLHSSLFFHWALAETENKPTSALTLSIEEQGARHGQALAAAEICPGAKITPKVEHLAQNFTGQDLSLFLTQSKKVFSDWNRAFACKDVDPAQTRDINGCRRAKILTCTVTWKEIGPEGTALPGLLEFRP